MMKTLGIIAIVLGIVFLALAFVYWTTPASGLPHFFPGYDSALAAVHFKHGSAALILVVLLFIFAWFATATKKAE